MPRRTNRITAGDLVNQLPFWAIGGGINGAVGGWTLSFFNPALASMAPGFLTCAGIGVIASPLIIIPRLLLERNLHNSRGLDAYPRAKEVLKDTLTLLMHAGVVTVAALALNAPLTATLASFMIIPTILYAFKLLTHGINAALENDGQLDHDSLTFKPI